MKEIIASIKEKLMLIENAYNDLEGIRKTEVEIELRQIDRDLRGLILMYLAVSKE
jgi:hypothetical protein